MSKLLVISHKRFWKKGDVYYTNGGFLKQIESISNKFESTTVFCQKIIKNEDGVFTNYKNINILPIKYFTFRKFSRKLNAIINFPYLFLKSLLEIKKHDSIHIILPGEGFIGLVATLFYRKNVVVRFCTAPKIEIYKMNIPFIRSSLFLIEKLNNRKNYFIYFTGHYDNEVDSKWKDFKWIFSTSLSIGNIPKYEIKQVKILNLLFIGRLDCDKNIRFSISVFRKILMLFPDSTFTIIGSGPDEKSLLKENIDLIQSRNLYLKGYLKIEDMSEIKRISNVFLFPSKLEGSPKVIPEVFSFGIPVVSSRAGNLSYLVQNDRGKTIKTFDVDLYVDAVIEVWENSDNYLDKSKNAYEFSKQLVLENWVAMMFPI